MDRTWWLCPQCSDAVDGWTAHECDTEAYQVGVLEEGDRTRDSDGELIEETR